MKKRIAFISEHASPLALLGSVDNGGQNVYVAEVTKQLARAGYFVDIFTRKDCADTAEIVDWQPGIRVIHVNAGPEKFVPKEDLLRHMYEFSANTISFIRREKISYALVHANFFMSGMVASHIKRALHIPYVITFHALGLVRQVHQKEMDRFPPERITIEKNIVREADSIIAECPQDKQDLIQYYQAPEERICIIPCGFSAEEFHPLNKAYARKLLGLRQDEKILLQLGRMVPRKGVDNVIRAMGHLKGAIDNLRLVIVGGETDAPHLNEPELLHCGR